jgi:folate-dependent tRNA-U54 methylase TrmFO/GidA
MVQGVAVQLVVITLTIPSTTTKHTTMVRAPFINSAKFIEEVCTLRNKKNLLINGKYQLREISV